MADTIQLITKTPVYDCLMYADRRNDGLYSEQEVLNHVAGMLKLCEVYALKKIITTVIFHAQKGFLETAFLIEIYGSPKKPSYQLYLYGNGRNMKKIIAYVDKYVAIMDGSRVNNLLTGVLSQAQKKNILSSLTEQEFNLIAGGAPEGQSALVNRVMSLSEITVYNQVG